MAKPLPDFDIMKTYYPTGPNPQQVKKQIGGDVDQPHYHNTCVIRISRAFNYAGHHIPHDTPSFRTKKGADGYWYGLRVSEFRKYMIQTYGLPTITLRRGKHDGPISTSRFEGNRGVICLAVDGWSDATGHFTLWEIDMMLYGEPDYFDRAYEALLWVYDSGWLRAPV